MYPRTMMRMMYTVSFAGGVFIVSGVGAPISWLISRGVHAQGGGGYLHQIVVVKLVYGRELMSGGDNTPHTHTL